MATQREEVAIELDPLVQTQYAPQDDKTARLLTLQETLLILAEDIRQADPEAGGIWMQALFNSISVLPISRRDNRLINWDTAGLTTTQADKLRNLIWSANQLAREHKKRTHWLIVFGALAAGMFAAAIATVLTNSVSSPEVLLKAAHANLPFHSVALAAIALAAVFLATVLTLCYNAYKRPTLEQAQLEIRAIVDPTIIKSLTAKAVTDPGHQHAIQIAAFQSLKTKASWTSFFAQHRTLEDAPAAAKVNALEAKQKILQIAGAFTLGVLCMQPAMFSSLGASIAAAIMFTLYILLTLAQGSTAKQQQQLEARREDDKTHLNAASGTVTSY